MKTSSRDCFKNNPQSTTSQPSPKGTRINNPDVSNAVWSVLPALVEATRAERSRWAKDVFLVVEIQRRMRKRKGARLLMELFEEDQGGDFEKTIKRLTALARVSQRLAVIKKTSARNTIRSLVPAADGNN